MSDENQEIINCPICKKDIDKGLFMYHLKDTHPELEDKDLLEISSKYYPLIDEITAESSKYASIITTVKGMKVWTYPPLNLVMDVEVEEGIQLGLMHTKIAGREVQLGAGFIELRNYDTFNDALMFFNEIATIFNILGVPIEFFKSYDLIFIGSLPKGSEVDLVTSKMSVERKTKIPTLNLSKDGPYLLLACYSVWEKIQEHDFLRETKIYEFLARSRLYLIQEEYRLSFIHAWIMIEALLRNKWERLMLEIHGSQTAIKNMKNDTRTWNMSVISETLFLIDSISKDELKKINLFRKKRNDLFHSPDSEVRIVSRTEASNIINYGLQLFYKEFMEFPEGKIIDFSSIRKKILNSLHRFE